MHDWTALIFGALISLASAHSWDSAPVPGSGDATNNFDNNCPLGNYDPADKQTVCSVILPSLNYVKDFINAAELVRYNCLQPEGPYFLVANTTCAVYLGSS